MHEFVRRAEFEGLMDVITVLALTYVPKEQVHQFVQDLHNLHATRKTTGERNEIHKFIAFRLEEETNLIS